MPDIIDYAPDAQEEIFELPEDAIEAGTDPFDTLTAIEPFWQTRLPSTLDENMTMNAILMAWSMKREGFGSYEAFQAMAVNDLVDWDRLMWMVSVAHRTGKIIDGDEE